MPIIKNVWLRTLVAKYVRLLIHRMMKSPVQAAHQEYSMIYSQHDNPGKPDDVLIGMALEAISLARSIDLSSLAERANWTYPNPNEFPGEHYRLLAGLVTLLKPKVIIEIGTERGMSCMAMKSALQIGGIIHTFDIKPWKDMINPVLRASDFDNSLVQHVADLTTIEAREKFRNLFEEADLIFMDAAKDGNMEKLFLTFFDTIAFRRSPVLVIDDIHNWNMLSIWREITLPKFDITSFGHFTGTGLVRLKP